MSFSDKTLTTLEFDKICDLLAACAATEGAKELCRRLMPSDDAVEVARRLERTTDARRLSDAKGMPPFGSVQDVSGACERAEKGAMLSTRELLEVARLLRSARALSDYNKTNRTFTTSLDEVFGRLLCNRTLEERITRSILSEDMIADEASPALADLRRKIRDTNNRIKETLQHFISGSYSKALQDNLVTTRNGRYVVPVKVECKNEIKGLIHDTSSSGATIFVEPMAVVEANNELRMLQSKEEHEIERIGRIGFETARKRQKKLTCVDKANVLDTSRLWREVMHRLAAEYPDVEYREMFVDNCAMQICKDPAQFDVIVTENMFGDILSDEASEITGSIGMVPSSSLGDGTRGLYEPIHGSAPDIAGQDIINPIACILSAAMMLRYSFDMAAEADCIEAAVNQVLNDGIRTADIWRPGCEKVGCAAMGDAILARL